MATKTLTQLVAEGFRAVARDQIAQDAKIAQTYATKAEVGGGDRTAVVIEQIIALYNGYNGTTLDYRDYLNTTPTEIEEALYGFCNSYNGTAS